MDPSDDAQGPVGPTSDIAALASEYRSHRDALREHANGLARMREQVLVAAEQQSRDIVAAVQGDVQEVIAKARRDLRTLATQVQATLEIHQKTASALTGVAERPVQTPSAGSPRPSRPVRVATEPPETPPAVLEGHVETPPDFGAFTAIVPPPDSVLAPRSIRAFLVAFVILGASVLAGTAWWMRQPTAGNGDANGEQSAQPVEPIAAVPPVVPPIVSPVDPPFTAARAEEPRPVSVTIEVRRQAWIRTVVDGRVVSARLFEPGETQQVTGSQEVSIRAGDAGAVFVSVNGREATALGRDGRPVTRRFEPDRPTESIGSSTPSLIGGAGVTPGVPELTVAPPPDNADPEARPQASTLGVNVPVAPPADTVPPLATAEVPPQPTATAASMRQEILRVAEQWLDAYFREDQNAMAVFADERLSVSDERTPNERLRGLAGRRLDLVDADVQAFGESAIFTAKVTERREGAEAARTVTPDALVSQIWTRRGGTWRLTDVRIVSGAGRARTVP